VGGAQVGGPRYSQPLSYPPMPRASRIILDGVPVHHIQRGNNRQRVFHDNRDRRLYLELLAEGCQRFGCAVHAYVLMDNHIHLLLTPAQQDGVARLTQWMGRTYVCRFNRRHARTGTLWEGRFRSSLIESARYFLTCSRYIDQNPVRAGMCATPGHFRWSSYGRLAYGRPDEVVVEHAAYRALGNTRDSRQQTYRALCEPPLSTPVLKAMRALGRGQGHGGDRRSEEFHSFRQRSPAVAGRSTTLTP